MWLISPAEGQASHRQHRAMTKYWFVVKPARGELYEALKSVLDGRPGFEVIKERRSVHIGPRTAGDRRRSHVWEGEDMLIAEQQDQMKG